MTIENFYLLTNKTNYKGKINPFAVTCQCCLETGYFKSELALKANNYAGIKKTKNWTGKIYTIDSPEYINGKKYIKRSEFRKYDNDDDFLKDYIVSKLYNSRYDNVRKYALDNYFCYFYFIWEGGWATDIAYFQKLVNTSFDLGPKLITPNWNNKAKSSWSLAKERINKYSTDKIKSKQSIEFCDNYFKRNSLIPIPSIIQNKPIKKDDEEIISEEIGIEENEFINQLDEKLPDDSVKWKICIDAGHGGKDSGAINKNLNVNEKDITLKIALELGSILEQTNNFDVVFTRKDDTYMTVNEKAAISNKNNCNLMFSIHCNSSSNKDVYGHEDIYFGKNNTVFSSKGKEFASCINKIWNKKFSSESKNRGIKFGNFAVVRETKCPAVLTEIEFISNDEKCKFMLDNIRSISECLAEGICDFVLKKK